MLVLSRKQNESLLIGDNVRLTITELKGGRVKIAIDAPANIKIFRSELKCNSNQQIASKSNLTLSSMVRQDRKKLG